MRRGTTLDEMEGKDTYLTRGAGAQNYLISEPNEPSRLRVHGAEVSRFALHKVLVKTTHFQADTALIARFGRSQSHVDILVPWDVSSWRANG